MGRLYLRSSCAPADYACPDAAGAEGSAALPTLAPLSARYRTICDARPWSPTQLTTHPFHYRTLRIPPVPQRASQGLARDSPGGRMHRDRNVPHVCAAFLCCRACQCPHLRSLGTRFISPSAPVGEALALVTFKQTRGAGRVSFVTHCSTATLSGNTKPRCVVTCRQLANQAPRNLYSTTPLSPV